jgi:16S rRNA (guanine1516-N2)-methyltransferase
LNDAKSKCAVVADDGYQIIAKQLARQLGLHFFQKPPEMAAFPCLLNISEQGVGLQLTGRKAPGEIRCDFVTGSLAHRRKFGGGKKQDLSRAIGLDKQSNLQIVDMTAGLGRDGFVLASLGAKVTLIERNPIVHTLLQNGLHRARKYAQSNDQQLLEIVDRINLFAGQSTWLVNSLPDELCADVIYLDPMFPGRQKSAKVKKEMQAFHILVGDDPDSDHLLDIALQTARYRVVVKRPVGAPFINGQKSTHSITGKSTRFDIYAIKKLGAP